MIRQVLLGMLERLDQRERSCAYMPSLQERLRKEQLGAHLWPRQRGSGSATDARTAETAKAVVLIAGQL